MCQYTTFHFLCGASKLKITTPCASAFTNYQGLTYCRLDPQAHVNDGIQRDTTHTYGPGICSNINCRDFFGMAPYEVSNTADLLEDDEEFDMSSEACAERETRWFRCLLSTDQQLECFSTNFPVPVESMTEYAKAFLYFNHLPANEWATYFASAWDSNPDEVTWQELNPKFMDASALQAATALKLLPAWVTDVKQGVPDMNIKHSRKSSTKKSRKAKSKSVQPLTTTPHMPLYGPFKTTTHTCLPAVGFCKTCGHYHGKAHRRKPFRFHEINFAAERERFNELDGETQRAMSEAAWGEWVHARDQPFHGNDFERSALGANHDSSSFNSLFEEQRTSTSMLDGSTTNEPITPATSTFSFDIDSSASFELQQFDCDMEVFRTPEPLPDYNADGDVSNDDFPGMDLIQQFAPTSFNEGQGAQGELNMAGEWMDQMDQV
ncbi:hypothetical protein PRZ48_005770 [Zasmidium cellare]|uniref:Uncharacterized protein n=1 Tax=Zasmidium cellare TaxID=395010 RepID=A0ABR0EM66_ZASCE|nr:hypothetical protein PRZ48_005770 [Zasmidium cellare]